MGMPWSIRLSKSLTSRDSCSTLFYLKILLGVSFRSIFINLNQNLGGGRLLKSDKARVP